MPKILVMSSTGLRDLTVAQNLLNTCDVAIGRVRSARADAPGCTYAPRYN
jgi:hypothetical protein